MAVNYDSLLNVYATNRDAQKNIAQNAMNEQIANSQAAFAKQDAAAKASRDSKYRTIDEGWNRGNDQVNQTAGKALQESYVNSQMQQLNLGQRLSAAGRQGGMAESTMLGLANEYGKVRGGHETTRANSLADLLLARNTDRNSATTAYEDWRTNAEGSLADTINKLKAQYSLQVQQAEQDYYQQQAELMLQQQQEAAAAAAAARSSGGGGGGGGGAPIELKDTAPTGKPKAERDAAYNDYSSYLAELQRRAWAKQQQQKQSGAVASTVVGAARQMTK